MATLAQPTGRTAVPFSNFGFGEYGTQSSYGVGFAIYRQHLLYRGWWTGQNVMRTIAGGLCPRAGEKPYILTGVPNGVIEGMGAASVGGFPYIWFAVGTTVYRFRADVFTSQAVDTYTGALGAFTSPLSWVDHTLTYVFAYPAGLYKLDHSAKTVAAVAAGPAAFNCCIYGDRLMAGSASRLYYSAAGDFDTWPANNYLDVGDAFNITSLDTVRGRLAVGKDGVFGEPWFVLSGVPGFNDVLRQAEVSLVAAHDEASVDMGEGVGLVTDVEGTLAVFDGTRLRPIPYLQVVNADASGIPSEVTAFRLRRPGEWGVVTDKTVDAHDNAAGSIWLFRNGAWSRHRRAIPAGVTSGAWSVSLGYRSQVVFGQGGDVSTPATFCSLNPYLDRPPFTSDVATVIDPALCSFSLPEWWARDATQVAVAAVVVDLVSYNTGDANPNTFTCNAVAMRTYDPAGTFSAGGGDKSTAPNATYSEATNLQSTSGTRKRVTLQYVPVFGNGFRLDFSNLRGVSIEKVVVVVDERPTPGI